MAGARLPSERRALAAICVFVVALGLWNVAHYPPGKGYDFVDHLSYALGLVPGGRLPRDTGEYYTPPGYYALAGSVVWLAHQVGLNTTDGERAAMALNVLFELGSVLLTFHIGRELWPERRWAAFVAAGFLALLPVAVEAEAMFHPDTLTLFLSTLAVWLTVRTFSRPRYAIWLGLTLGVAQLVRAFSLYTVAAVLLVLLFARRWRTFVIVLVLAALVPAPWYVHQELVYGGDPVFPQPTTALGRSANGKPKPVYDREPLRFYLDPGLPQAFSAPYQPHFVNEAIPETYVGIWGDYFGAWLWVPRPPPHEVTNTHFPPPRRSVRARLVAQSIIGVLPTLLALCGWVLLLVRARGRPGWLLIVLLPPIALLAYLYHAAAYPTDKGDVLKTSFVLVSAPAWALAFGYAVSSLRGRALSLLGAALVLCALVDLSFVVYA